MKKFLLGILSFCVLGLGASHALILEFVNLNMEGLLERFAETHFMAPGNDFAGAIFWLPARSLFTPEAISLDGETKYCKKLLRGMYYNSQRGERLWPLDVQTLATLQEANDSYDGLSIAGGLYTVCGEDDLYSIVGQIDYDWDGTTSTVTAGTQIDYWANWLYPHFAKTFEYFSNTFPLGYIVDTIGGIGFVGGVLEGHECLICYLNGNCTNPACNTTCTGESISELFVYSGNMIYPANPSCGYEFTGGGLLGELGDIQWGITIQGNVGLSQSLEEQDREVLLGNYNQKIAVVNVPKVNISTLVNDAKKNSRNLCRGLKNFAGQPVPAGLEDKVICFLFDTYSSSNTVTVDLANASDKAKYLGKTFVIENGDLYLRNSMQNSDDPLDLFIDNGNLYLDRQPADQLTAFGSQGYPSVSAPVTEGLFLKGNIIINGLVLGNSGTQVAEVAHKLYVHGKLNSLNTPVEPSDGRKEQVSQLFGSSFYDNWINYQRIFTWYCNPITGSGSDGVACFDDDFADSPLVIIGQDFDSKLY